MSAVLLVALANGVSRSCATASETCELSKESK
eukprot:COSAG06_NODE_58285_length_277_cov_1.022472_1_plen_31_part_10